MKKLIQKIKARITHRVALVLTGISSASGILLTLPNIANAQAVAAALTLANLVGGNNIYDVLIKLLNQISYLVLTVTAIYVKICASILNVAINLTMNISWFVNDNPAIETTWITIRDFSSIFFIGMLVYASICLIIGVGGPGIKRTIINVVWAALLVNFSLFITKALIDVSNVATLSIYSSIAPGEVVRLDNGTLSRQQSLLSDNGMSNVLMGLLRLQTIYDPKASVGPNAAITGVNRGSVIFRMIVATVMGSIIMIIAGTNFAVISLIFLARFAILILLLIFSPIAFLGNIVPTLGEHTKRWWKELYDQLLFPPIYFIILYVALKIMTEPRFQNLMGGSTKNGTFASAFLDAGSAGIGVIIQYGIVIFLIIQALLIAKKSSGAASEFTDKYIKKYGGMVTGAVLSNTVGLGAAKIRESESYKKLLANKVVSSTAGMAIDEGLKATSKAKFGSAKSYQDRVDAYGKRTSEYSKSLANPDAGDRALLEHNDLVKKQKEELERASNSLINLDSRPDIAAKKKAAKDAGDALEKLKTDKLSREASGDIPDPDAPEKIAKAEREHTEKLRALETATKSAHDETSKKVEDLRKQLEKLDNEEARKNVKKQATQELQRKYVGQLNNQVLFRRQGRIAAGKISGELGKDKAQQDLDALKALIERASAPPKP